MRLGRTIVRLWIALCVIMDDYSLGYGLLYVRLWITMCEIMDNYMWDYG